MKKPTVRDTARVTLTLTVQSFPATARTSAPITRAFEVTVSRAWSVRRKAQHRDSKANGDCQSTRADFSSPASAKLILLFPFVLVERISLFVALRCVFVYLVQFLPQKDAHSAATC